MSELNSPPIPQATSDVNFNTANLINADITTAKENTAVIENNNSSKKLFYIEKHVFRNSIQKIQVKYKLYNTKSDYFFQKNDILFYSTNNDNTYFLVASSSYIFVDNDNISRFVIRIGRSILKNIFKYELNLIPYIKIK